MISVALCSYNGEKYIEEQIKSILEQTVKVDEIVVCDDMSKDRTGEIVRQIQRSNIGKTEIRVYVNKTNLGVTKNFEKALSLCKGDIIFLSDQDDIWIKNKVEIILDIFNENEKCQLVFTDAYLVDESGNDMANNLWKLTNPPVKGNYCIRDFFGLRFVTGATVALRKGLLKHTLPIPDCWIHDAWLAANASIYGGVKSINEKLIMYRQHRKNVIGAKKRSLYEQIRYTLKHIEDSKKFRAIMKNRFITLYKRSKAQMTEIEKRTIKEGIRFWNDSENIKKVSKFKGINLIIRNIAKRNYKKYNHGFYGAMVDLLILIK